MTLFVTITDNRKIYFNAELSRKIGDRNTVSLRYDISTGCMSVLFCYHFEPISEGSAWFPLHKEKHRTGYRCTFPRLLYNPLFVGKHKITINNSRYFSNFVITFAPLDKKY